MNYISSFFYSPNKYSDDIKCTYCAKSENELKYKLPIFLCNECHKENMLYREFIFIVALNDKYQTVRSDFLEFKESFNKKMIEYEKNKLMNQETTPLI